MQNTLKILLSNMNGSFLLDTKWMLTDRFPFLNVNRLKTLLHVDRLMMWRLRLGMISVRLWVDPEKKQEMVNAQKPR